MKLPAFFQKRKLQATTATLRRGEAMHADEPNMKLSSAFVVVLVLHVVAVGGIYAFNSIKAHQPADAAAIDPKMRVKTETESAE
ncbi:MAG: hypothetical protein QOD99_1931, partial [Chthoniobacter sp.]|nr:hypothetical protein [Chthoniobacter sp.]